MTTDSTAVPRTCVRCGNPITEHTCRWIGETGPYHEICALGGGQHLYDPQSENSQ